MLWGAIAGDDSMANDPGKPSDEGGGPKARIFISYSRKDIAFVDRLEPALKSRGFELLIDRSEIYAFEDWWKRIETLIGKADTVVFVLSPDSVASEVCAKEVAHAASLNKRFAPIVWRQVADNAVPEALGRLNFVFFDDPARLEASTERLAEALATDIGWIRKHTEYGETARRWDAAGRPSGLLLRSPTLEEAEHWIGARPHGAPEPTGETRSFVTESRRGATRRRSILTGSLAAGLVVALVLAGLAYWQRGIALEQRALAEQQRQRAEETLAAATQTANTLIFDLAQRFQNVVGVPTALVKDILDRAIGLQKQLTASGEVTPALRRSQGVALIESVTTLLAIGDTAGALAAAEAARKIFDALVASDSANTDWQRHRAHSYERLGNVLMAEGRREEALAAYRESLAKRQRLAESDESNADWQWDLSVSHVKVGDALAAAGRRDDALASYETSLGIVQRLADKYKDNPGWQRELSLGYEKIGDVLRESGQPEKALEAYQKRLAISQRLAASDKSNAEWQRDVAISYARVGYTLAELGRRDEALKAYRDGFDIIKPLADSDKGNTQWQRDLSFSYVNIADLLVATGQREEALASYRESLVRRQQLADSDKRNVEWQNDVAASYSRIAVVMAAMGQYENALDAHQKSLAIVQRLAEADGGNVRWQQDLGSIYVGIGYVLAKAGRADEAVTNFQKALAIRRRLVDSDKNNDRWQRDLANVYFNVGVLQGTNGRLDEALAAFREALTIRRSVAERDKGNAQVLNELDAVISQIGVTGYRFILARDFGKALAALDEAIALAPEKTWMYVNRAHALMFADRVDEARALYLRFRGTQNVQDGKSWEAVVVEDFGELRRAGLTHPLMDEIEKAFAAR
jgi:tetratricopeptide (TPR) repeat protein